MAITCNDSRRGLYLYDALLIFKNIQIGDWFIFYKSIAFLFMNKSRQYLLLSILVIFPILVFVFLMSMGNNTYPLDIYHTQWIEEVEVDGQPYLDTLRDASALEGHKIVDTIYHHISNFELTDQEGKTFKGEQLSGKVYVADFFFTRCGNPTLCPRMSTELKRVQENFKDNDLVKIVSFTVDPANDTPEVLKEYAGRYQAKYNKWKFLTGKKEKIYDLAYNSFKVNAMEEGSEVTPEFLHATKFMLIDAQGRVRGYYEGTSREEVDKLILEIKILLHEIKNS